MSFRPLNQSSLKNYPKIHIDRESVIKPCLADGASPDPFLIKANSSWKKLYQEIWTGGIRFFIRYVENITITEETGQCHAFFVKVAKNLTMILDYIYRAFLFIYGYLYPYSLKPLDQICDEFSRCRNWSESVIKSFAWHPTCDRCAIALCNNYIYVYRGPDRVRVLRHCEQTKITDMTWQPKSKEILVVSTQTNIIIWRISDATANLISKDDMKLNLAHMVPKMHQIVADGSAINAHNLVKADSTIPCDEGYSNTQVTQKAEIYRNLLPAPIVSISFDPSGRKVLACSPNSPKILILTISQEIDSDSSNMDDKRRIAYVSRFGQGLTRMAWAPDKTRIAISSTGNFFSVFEPTRWSSNWWSSKTSTIQDLIWSKPQGRMLLLANKEDSVVYAVPFLDECRPGDVGGNKSVTTALDTRPTQSEFGEIVGGRIHSFAWDSAGRRLAISFIDNPECVLLYRTVEKPTLELHQLGVIKGDDGSLPLLMDFHDKFVGGSLLTICWNNGLVQHLPLSYNSQDQDKLFSQKDLRNDSTMGRSLNGSLVRPSTPRSLTNFCHVTGNNTISPNTSILSFNRTQRYNNTYGQTSEISYVNGSIDTDL